MSGSSASSNGTTNPQATPKQMLGIYNNYLPASLATTVNQAQPVANSLAGAAAGANPIYTASGLNQLNNYAPGYADSGNRLQQQQVLGQSDLLGGAGGLYALEGAGLTNLLNPAQMANNRGAANLVNSYNMNGLSGGDQAAAERSLNQSNYATGNLGIDNATNAVSNAMNFGNAFAAKRAALGQALGASNGIAQSQNTAFNPIQAIQAAGNVSGNFGLGTFNPTQANGNITAPLSFGSSLGNQIAGVSSASRGTTTSSSGGGGCYLTTACCEYRGLPDNCEELQTLRAFRDNFVPREMVEEYYKCAPAIVCRIKGDSKLMEYVYQIVKLCVRDIKLGRNDIALSKYRGMFLTLNSLNN